MTDPQQPASHETPSRRDRLRPLELLGFSAVLSIFAGLVVLLTMRDEYGNPHFVMAAICAGIAFIVVVLMVALLTLGGKPSDEDVEARKDLQDPSSDTSNWH